LTPLRDIQISHVGLFRDSRLLGLRSILGFLKTKGEKCRNRQLSGLRLYDVSLADEFHRVCNTGGVYWQGKTRVVRTIICCATGLSITNPKQCELFHFDFQYDLLLRFIHEILFISSTSNTQNDCCMCQYNERALICGQCHCTSFRSIIIIDIFITNIKATDYYYGTVTRPQRLARLCLYTRGDLRVFASVMKQPPVGQGLLIVEASRLRADTHHTQ
jgi:hypothetical protein